MTSVKWTATALAVLLLGWIGWKAFREPQPYELSPGRGAPAATALQESASEQVRPAEFEASAPASVERTAMAEKARFWGRVLCEGIAVPGARVAIFEDEEGWRDSAPLAETRSGTDGVFELAVDPGEAMRFHIQASAAGFRRFATATEVPETALELPLLRAWILRGTVRDADTSKTIAGAKLDLGYRQAETDPHGAFRLEELVSGEVAIEVRHADYVIQRLQSRIVDADVDLDIALQSGQKLAFELIDHGTELPVAEARADISGHQSLQASSDASGRFELHVLRGHQVSVDIEADGYLPLQWHWEIDRSFEVQTIRLPMIKPARLVGTVVFENHEPAYWAEVRAGDGSKDLEQRAERWSLPAAEAARFTTLGRTSYRVDLGTHTSSKGRFELDLFPTTAPWLVRASHMGSISPQLQPLVLVGAETKELDPIVLRKGGVVRGSVRRNGRPWKGQVVLSAMDGSVIDRAATDSPGEFEFRKLRRGEYVVQLQGIEPVLPLHRAKVEVDLGQEVTHDFSWNEDRASMTGVVVKVSGDVVEGAQVRAVNVEPTDLPPAMTKTDASGRFEIDLPASQAFQLTASLGASSVTQQGVVAGAKDLRLVLPQLGILDVRLLDADTHEPLRLRELALPYAISWRSTAEPVYRTLGSPSLDEQGRTRINLPVGSIDLCFSFLDAGYVRREIDGIPVGETNEELVVLLSRGIDRSIELAPGSIPLAEQEGHILFLLAEDQLDQVAGPFPLRGGPSNRSVSGINLWLADPGLLNQRLHFVEPGVDSLRGFTPGRYFLRSYPDDLVFEPTEIELRADAAFPVQVLLRHR
jgi:hypothetical protein